MQNRILSKSKNYLPMALSLGMVFLLGLIFSEYSFAAGAKGLGEIAENVQGELKPLAQLLVITAYVAGIGFAISGIVKFKAHKDNPTQVPLSAPIVLLVVGACLLFLPGIMTSAGQTIFGSTDNKSSEFSGF